MVSDRSLQNATLPNKEIHKEYWLEKLKGSLPSKGFGRKSGMFDSEERKDAAISREIPEHICERILAMSANSDYGIFLILLSAVKCLIFRCTGNADILTAVPVFRQKSEGTYINNVLPLRTKLHVDMTFKELLLHVKDIANEANSHRNFPVMKIMKALNLENAENSPFGIMALLDNIHREETAAEIRADVAFRFSRAERSLRLCLDYHEDLYEKDRIQDISRRFIEVLDEVTAHASAKLGELKMPIREEMSEESSSEAMGAILDIKPLHKGIWDCMENTLVTLLSWYGRNHEMVFAETWGFGFPPTNSEGRSNIGERIKTMKGEAADLVEKYYGLKVDTIYNKNVDISLKDIKAQLKKGCPVGLNLNLRWCPWSDFYKSYDAFHICVAVGMDKEEENLYIVDPTLEKSGVCLPVVTLEEACFAYGMISIVGEERKEIDWHEVLSNAAHRLQGKSGIPNAFEEMRAFARTLKGQLNLKEEMEGYQKPIHSLLISNLLYVSEGRINFANVLKYLAKRYDEKELMLLAQEVERAGWKWQALRMLFMKACNSAELYLDMDHVMEEIEKIAGFEEKLTSRMLELAEASSAISSLRAHEKEQKEEAMTGEREAIFVDIGEHANHKGFSSIAGEEKSQGFDDNGYFYLADHLPKSGIIEAEGFRFSFPDASGAGDDNIACSGQTIEVPAGEYCRIDLLGSAENGNFLDKMYMVYADGFEEEAFLQFSDWWEPEPNFGESVVCSVPCGRYVEGRMQEVENKVSLFAKSYQGSHHGNIKSIKLPEWPNLHIFAISLVRNI